MGREWIGVVDYKNAGKTRFIVGRFLFSRPHALIGMRWWANRGRGSSHRRAG